MPVLLPLPPVPVQDPDRTWKGGRASSSPSSRSSIRSAHPRRLGGRAVASGTDGPLSYPLTLLLSRSRKRPTNDPLDEGAARKRHADVHAVQERKTIHIDLRRIPPIELAEGHRPVELDDRQSERLDVQRRLIGEYEETLAELLDGLSSANHAIAVDIASIPEQIRGYADVKERHLEQARQKQAELLGAFRLRGE